MLDHKLSVVASENQELTPSTWSTLPNSRNYETRVIIPVPYPCHIELVPSCKLHLVPYALVPTSMSLSLDMRCTPSHSHGEALAVSDRGISTRATATTAPASQQREIDTPTWTAFDLSAALVASGETLPPVVSSSSTTRRPREWLPLPIDRVQAARHALVDRRSWAGPGITDDGAPRTSPPLRKARRISSAILPAPLVPLPDPSIPPICRASYLLSSNGKSGSARAPDNQNDTPHENQQQSRQTLDPAQEESYRYATCILNGLNDLEKSLMRVSKDLRYVCVNIRTDSGSRICPDEVHPNDDDVITALEGTTECGPNKGARKVDVDRTTFDARDTNKNSANTVTSFHDFVYALSKRVLADVFVLNKIFRKRTTPILDPVLDAFRQCGANVSGCSSDLQSLSELANRMFRQPERGLSGTTPLSSKTPHDVNKTTPMPSLRNYKDESPTHVRLLEACREGIDSNLYPKFYNNNDVDLVDYDLTGCYLSQEEVIDFWNNDKAFNPLAPSTARSVPAQAPPFAVDLAAIKEPFVNTGSSGESQLPPPLPQFRLSRPMVPPVPEKQPASSVNPTLPVDSPSLSPQKPRRPLDTAPFPTRRSSFPSFPGSRADSPPIPRKRQPVTIIHDSSDEEGIRPAPENRPDFKSPHPTPSNRREKSRADHSPTSFRRPDFRQPASPFRPSRMTGPQAQEFSRLPFPQQPSQVPRSSGDTRSLLFGSPRGLRCSAAPRFEQNLPSESQLMRERGDFTRDRGRKRNWEHIRKNEFGRRSRRSSFSPPRRDARVDRNQRSRPRDPRTRDFSSLRVPNDRVPPFRYRSPIRPRNYRNRRSYSQSPSRPPRNFNAFQQRHSSVAAMPLLPIPRMPNGLQNRAPESGNSSRHSTPIVEID